MLFTLGRLGVPAMKPVKPLKMCGQTLQWAGAAIVLLIPFLLVKQILVAMEMPTTDPLFRGIESVVFFPTLIFKPFEGMMPVAHINGEAVPMYPATEALIILITSYVLNIVALVMMGLEQKVDQAVDTARFEHSVQEKVRLLSRRQQELRESLQYWMVVQFDYEKFPDLAERFFGHLHPVKKTDSLWIFSCTSCSNTLEVSSGLREDIYRHYNTLRPMDPQPPIRVMLNAYINDKTPLEQVLFDAEQMLRFCEDFRIQASQEFFDGFQANETVDAHRYERFGVESLGEFSFSDKWAANLYRVYIKKTMLT
jgi:hypothetical protein